jgi:Protein phosphatase 2C
VSTPGGDRMVGGAGTHGWHLAGIGVSGERHLAHGSGREDAHVLQALPGGALVACVADGVSAVSRGGEGATIACGSALDWLRGALSGIELPELPREGGPARTRARGEEVLQLARGAMRVAHERLLDAAVALTRKPPAEAGAAFATTLTVLVAHAPWLATVAIGDGFVVVRRDDGSHHLLLPPDESTGFVNRVHSLAAHGALDHARETLLWDPGVTGVAVSTDGLRQVVLEHPPDRPSMPNPALFSQLLDVLDRDLDPSMIADAVQRATIFRDRTDDDRTLLLAVRA